MEKQIVHMYSLWYCALFKGLHLGMLLLLTSANTWIETYILVNDPFHLLASSSVFKIIL